jgi:uncharacterized protein
VLDAIVWLLVNRPGAEVEVATSVRRTPLHVAASRGDEKITRVLLEKATEDVVNAANPSGVTALHAATAGGH